MQNSERSAGVAWVSAEAEIVVDEEQVCVKYQPKCDWRGDWGTYQEGKDGEVSLAASEERGRGLQY